MSAVPLSPRIDPVAIDAFQKDGAVILRGVFDDWISSLRQGMEQVMAEPSPLERTSQPPGSVRFFQDLCNWQRIPAFREFVMHSPAAGLAAALMESRQAR